MGFKKILAAVRSTQGPSPVFEQALELAKNQDASLMIYHCMAAETLAEYEDRIVSVSTRDTAKVEKAFHDRLKENIEHRSAWLESLCNRAKKEGVKAQCLVEEGKIGNRITDLARSWEADLIVLGRTRRGSIADVLFGTVSDHVIHRARCSLLLVQ